MIPRGAPYSMRCWMLRDTILEAADGRESLAALDASGEPLIVLLDGQMPWLDGFGVLQAAVPDAQLRPAHRFVLVTAIDWQQPEPACRAVLEQLQMPVIAIPFDLTAFSQAVEQASDVLSPDHHRAPGGA